MEQKLKLSPPWVTYANEVRALFQDDDEVKVVYENDICKLNIYVENQVKAEAISKLLPETKTFGNIEMKINVIPANALKENSKVDLLCKMFEGNDAVRDIRTYNTPFGELTYVVFAARVVQFFNDDMSDVNGNKNTLYQEIAKDVLGEESSVFFCTEATLPTLEKPLGEWP